MPSTTMNSVFNPLELAAVTAAINRARTGRSAPLGPEPGIHSEKDGELAWVERVLRHRLRLDSLNRPVAVRTEYGCIQPLLTGGQHYRAAVLTVPSRGNALSFLATYDEQRRLSFDLVDLCSLCQQQVPTEEITCFEDLGDYLLQARDALGGSPRFRYSPAHAADCPAHGD
ncbi:hypothetical protein [Streptomyces sp. MZ04]|uniref:hypothetical protein n=1 Tax=Streptomyces sp. MZ04 TaxID=2559236 RepID=UPI00107E8963|nr:hypothetical protein [Streptomyces sp. MZ04]TGB15484.1 hypothetical protein E2651_02310 [Streptomyces sp. MZ04]